MVIKSHKGISYSVFFFSNFCFNFDFFYLKRTWKRELVSCHSLLFVKCVIVPSFSFEFTFFTGWAPSQKAMWLLRPGVLSCSSICLLPCGLNDSSRRFDVFGCCFFPFGTFQTLPPLSSLNESGTPDFFPSWASSAWMSKKSLFILQVQYLIQDTA